MSPTPSPRAAIRRNAVVAVTRGLLARLNDREVEAVLGHELAHVKNRDVAVMTWAGLIVIMAGYLMQMLFWMSLFGGFGGRDRRDGDGGGIMLVMMAVYVGTIAIYFIAQLLVMALSRYREYAADRGGAIVTGAPMQLASALAKISNDMYRIPDQDLREVRHANALMFAPTLSCRGNHEPVLQPPSDGEPHREAERNAARARKRQTIQVLMTSMTNVA